MRLNPKDVKFVVMLWLWMGLESAMMCFFPRTAFVLFVAAVVLGFSAAAYLYGDV